MGYYFSKTLPMDFERAVEKVMLELHKEGFGVLSDIDVKAALKQKLDVDYHPYRILGACNPAFAYKALSAENKIGTILPCNVIVQDMGGKTEVAAIDPLASMHVVDNDALREIAIQIRAKLKKVIDVL